MKRYQESLIHALRDPEEAAAYLNAALEDGRGEMFLVALRNVAEANGGMSAVSQKSKLNRANLYKIFSKNGNPEINSLSQILRLFGLRLAVASRKNESKKAA